MEFVLIICIIFSYLLIAIYTQKNNIEFMSVYSLLYLFILLTMINKSINMITGFIIMMVISLCYCFIIFKLRNDYKRKLIVVKDRIKSCKSINVDTFYKFNIEKNINGIYVLYNLEKDIYYVGSSKNVISNVKKDFNGKGNKDVYLDYNNGDNFNIYIILFEPNTFSSLSEQEKYYIEAFDSFNNGYNKITDV